MTERPILFTGPMVRAILEGRKTQTRRVVKPQAWAYANDALLPDVIYARAGEHDFGDPDHPIRCPYGVPGDRLWVRETFNADWTDRVIYKADGGSAVEAGWPREPRWKPSIFMPRADCRLVLEVTAVRVERLQEISVDDAIAEGAAEWGVREGKSKVFDGRERGVPYMVNAYAELWDSLNAKRAPWASNPWVWVVEFKPLAANIHPASLEEQER